MKAWLTFGLAILTVGCAKALPRQTLEPPTFDEKVSWILRLENQRVIRDPSETQFMAEDNAGGPSVVRDSASDLRPDADLVALLADPEPQLRRRAALALGRIGLAEGVDPLIKALADPQVEVRQMSAFALGLIGDPSATPALVELLQDSEPIVQGRAAEALGRVGAVETASEISNVVRSHVAAAFDLDPDNVSFPLSPEIEAFRLGLYALGVLGAYEPLAEAVLQESGQPLLWWWPVAYALQRTGDPRAVEALISLTSVQGSVGVAFAARGLGALGGRSAPEAVDALVLLLDLERRDTRVIATTIRALARINDPRVGEELRQFVLSRELPPTLRLEALEALRQRPTPGATELLIELMADPWPPMRAAALKALATAEPETFMLVLSGLELDTDWRVRAALADGLVHVDSDAAAYQLTVLLEDEDQRVIPSVLRSLFSQEVPDVTQILLDHLKRDDLVVRKTAATLLGELGSRDDTSQLKHEISSSLIQAFEVAQADSGYLVRAAILDALAAIGGPAFQATLTAALSDADWAVRVRAAESLDTLKPGGNQMAAIRPAPGRRSIDFEAPDLVRPTVSPRVYIETNHGTIELELNVIDAPLTAENFSRLARSGFYDGLTFHRVVPNYVVQTGDPRGDSEGGPGYTLRDELNQLPHLRGAVSMVLDSPDSGGSQFFITHSPQPDLDGRYTVFARVVSGMEVVDQIESGDMVRRVVVWDGVAPF